LSGKEIPADMAARGKSRPYFPHGGKVELGGYVRYPVRRLTDD
jgi:hypothetical protein